MTTKLELSSHEQVIFLCDNDPRIQEGLARVAESTREGQLLPFLGAGVSRDRPSGLPLAVDLLRPLWETMERSVTPFLDTVGPEYVHPWRAEISKRIRRSPLERLLSVLQDVHGRQCIDRYLSVLESSEWNENHAAVAALARDGFLRACITLNFDLLIEEAVKVTGVSCETVCPLYQHGTRSYTCGEGPLMLKIIKPHGSLSAEEWGIPKFGALAASLDEIGDHPRGANIIAIERCIANHPVLLVAGYSDCDWDVSPIIQRCSGRLRHVHWLQFATPDYVKRREVPSDERFEQVLGWLQGTGIPYTLWVGNAQYLFSRLLENLHCDAPPTVDMSESRDFRLPDGSVFEPQPLRSALATTLLWQDRRGVGSALREWLHAQEGIRGDSWLHGRLHRTAAQTEHTEHRLQRAMRHTRAAIQLKLSQVSSACLEQSVRDCDPERFRGLGGDVIWLGYEHLCLVKRPSVAAPWGLARRRHHVKVARELFGLGLKLSRTTDLERNERLQAQTRYYFADLKHSWAEQRLVFRPAVAASAYREVCEQYDELGEAYPWFFDEPYYWLRRLEARLLARVCTPEERKVAAERFEEIITGNRLLYSHVQAGNAYLYRALVRFVECEHRLGAVAQREVSVLLNCAFQEWAQPGAIVASGLRRIAVYRRYFGLTSIGQMIRDLLRVRAMVRVHDEWSAVPRDCADKGEIGLWECAGLSPSGSKTIARWLVRIMAPVTGSEGRGR